MTPKPPVLTDKQKMMLRVLGKLVKATPTDNNLRIVLCMAAPVEGSPPIDEAGAEMWLSAIGNCCEPCGQAVLQLFAAALPDDEDEDDEDDTGLCAGTPCAGHG